MLHARWVQAKIKFKFSASNKFYLEMMNTCCPGEAKILDFILLLLPLLSTAPSRRIFRVWEINCTLMSFRLIGNTQHTLFFRSKTNTKLADEFLMKCPCLHRSALISSDVCWDEKLFYCFTSSLKNFSSQNKFSTFSLSLSMAMNEWMNDDKVIAHHFKRQDAILCEMRAEEN